MGKTVGDANDEKEEESSSRVQRERVPKKIFSPSDSQHVAKSMAKDSSKADAKTPTSSRASSKQRKDPVKTSSKSVSMSSDGDIAGPNPKSDSSVNSAAAGASKKESDHKELPPVEPTNAVVGSGGETNEDSSGAEDSSSSEDKFVPSLAERVKRQSAAKIEASVARITAEKKAAQKKSKKKKKKSHKSSQSKQSSTSNVAAGKSVTRNVTAKLEAARAMSPSKPVSSQNQEPPSLDVNAVEATVPSSGTTETNVDPLNIHIFSTIEAAVTATANDPDAGRASIKEEKPLLHSDVSMSFEETTVKTSGTEDAPQMLTLEQMGLEEEHASPPEPDEDKPMSSSASLLQLSEIRERLASPSKLTNTMLPSSSSTIPLPSTSSTENAPADVKSKKFLLPTLTDDEKRRTSARLIATTSGRDDKPTLIPKMTEAFKKFVPSIHQIQASAKPRNEKGRFTSSGGAKQKSTKAIPLQATANEIAGEPVPETMPAELKPDVGAAEGDEQVAMTQTLPMAADVVANVEMEQNVDIEMPETKKNELHNICEEPAAMPQDAVFEERKEQIVTAERIHDNDNAESVGEPLKRAEPDIIKAEETKKDESMQPTSKPRGSLKFKISLKGNPSIKASTPPCQAKADVEESAVPSAPTKMNSSSVFTEQRDDVSQEVVQVEVDESEGTSPGIVEHDRYKLLETFATSPAAATDFSALVNDTGSLPTDASSLYVLAARSCILQSSKGGTQSTDKQNTGQSLRAMYSTRSKTGVAVPTQMKKSLIPEKPTTSKSSAPVSSSTRSTRMPPPPFKRPLDTGSSESSQTSASPELGEAGLGFSYYRPEIEKKLRQVAEEQMETETIGSRQLRPRKNAAKRKVEQIVKPMPYFTGTAKPLTPFPPKVLSAAAERANAIAALTDGIRNALLSDPPEDEDETEPSENEIWEDSSEKWTRPELEKGQEYDPEDFEEVKADCPTLRSAGLAALDADRDEPFWERPENPDEYYKLWDEEIRKYMRTCKLLEIPIDRSLRHLHAHCGHNVQQAIKTIKSRAVNMILWKPLNEREQSVFEEVYKAYGKNFHKIGKYLPHIPILRIVQHYYKSKKEFQYKKRLMGQKVKSDEKAYDALASCCSFCKRKCRKLHSYKRFEGDEFPRMVCGICREYRKKLIEKTQEDEELFGGNFDQEIHLPFNYEALSEKLAYRAETSEAGNFITFPSDINELFEPFKLPNFDEVTSIALHEQQRLKLLGQTGPMLDAEELGENFYKSLQNMFAGPAVDREEEEKKLRERTAANKKECKRLLDEIMATGILDEGPMPDFKNTPLGKRLKKMKKPPKVAVTEKFSEIDYKFTLKTFMRYGVDFEKAAEIVRNKTPEMIEEFYNANKASFDYMLKPYHGKTAIDKFKEKMKAERPQSAWYYDKHLEYEEEAAGSSSKPDGN